jgi:hypothetical protein
MDIGNGVGAILQGIMGYKRGRDDRKARTQLEEDRERQRVAEQERLEEQRLDRQLRMQMTPGLSVEDVEPTAPVVPAGMGPIAGAMATAGQLVRPGQFLGTTTGPGGQRQRVQFDKQEAKAAVNPGEGAQREYFERLDREEFPVFIPGYDYARAFQQKHVEGKTEAEKEELRRILRSQGWNENEVESMVGFNLNLRSLSQQEDSREISRLNAQSMRDARTMTNEARATTERRNAAMRVALNALGTARITNDNWQQLATSAINILREQMPEMDPGEAAEIAREAVGQAYRQQPSPPSSFMQMLMQSGQMNPQLQGGFGPPGLPPAAPPGGGY